jgi:hypothetical protein
MDKENLKGDTLMIVIQLFYDNSQVWKLLALSDGI